MAYRLLILLLFYAFQASAQTTTQPGNTTTTPTGNIIIMSFGKDTFSRGEGRLFNNNLATNITIWGGTAGASTAGECSAKTSGGVCNNCSSGTAPCNARRIHDDLLFTVVFETKIRGQVRVEVDNEDNTNLEYVSPVNDSQIFEAGTTITLQIKWSEICNRLWGQPCDSVEANASVQRVRIGVTEDSSLDSGEYTTELQFAVASMDASNGTIDLCQTNSEVQSGACNFIAYPGDEQIFLENVRTNCSFPDLGTAADARFIRVFGEKVDDGFTQADFPDASSPVLGTLALGDSTTACSSSKVIDLEDNVVSGLENDSVYTFAIGVVDEAENVGFITDTKTQAVVDLDDNSQCFTGADWEYNCHATAPGEVIGLIEDEFDCFITTATYGSPFKPKVKTFRQFRNQYLKSNWLGRKVISTYYKLSPPIAAWIRNHPQSKSWVRATLWPLWAFAKVSLEYPMALLVLLLMPVAIGIRKLTGRVL